MQWLEGEKPLSLAIQEKYDQLHNLINLGKERGFLLYDDVNEILPAFSAASFRIIWCCQPCQSAESASQ